VVLPYREQMLSKLLKQQAELHKIDLAHRDHWNTPLGKIVLDDLKRNFLPHKLTTDNPHTTAMNARAMDFFNYIQRRIDDGMDGKSA